MKAALLLFLAAMTAMVAKYAASAPEAVYRWTSQAAARFAPDDRSPPNG